LEVQDTGYYLCWAENLVQRTYAQVRVEVQGKIRCENKIKIQNK